MYGRKQAALERFVRLEPWKLIFEAKIEICRASRDLRSCGRAVHGVLLTCGHACLCVECLQRIDGCPICRSPTARSGLNKLRLYEECVYSGLIQKDAELQSESDDVCRLYSLFDVALENNLVSLICHYVAEVCMDEGAVSSNALVSVLLDGDVVKDWCKRTFHSITLVLRDIYCLHPNQMLNKADAIDWNRRKLEGVILVLESLEAPLVDQPLSSLLFELRQLLESMRKVLQHMEVMAWCARHQFLETIRSSYSSTSQWYTAVHERKSAAQDRAWLEISHMNGKRGVSHAATLFIEDALANLGSLERDDQSELGDLSELRLLRHGPTAHIPASRGLERYLDSIQSKSPYPPESVRTAVDMLFLEGTCDLLLAKKAIVSIFSASSRCAALMPEFLYFLFDRHWASHDENWREVVDDYVNTFNIPRHFMLESLVFFLLDNSCQHALEEACHLLPELCTHNTHPKVVTVLLERQRSKAALAILRPSGRDGQAEGLVPLTVALTAVGVWLHCGLPTEGYLYQRAYVDGVKREGGDWKSSMEVLVSEMCRISIGMSLLDKMLFLPWRKEEENHFRKCLLDRAGQDPSSAAGNLLLVFYVQRCRFIEAHRVHGRLNELENLWGEICTDEVVFSRVRMASEQRARIVEKCVELLPGVQQYEARNADENDVESPHTATPAPEEHTTSSLPSPLFSHAGRNLMRGSLALREDKFPSTSAWASYCQPSITQKLLRLRSPALSTSLILNMKSSSLITMGPKSAREAVDPGELLVHGGHLRFEAEQHELSHYFSTDIGNEQRGDRFDAAGLGFSASSVEKRMPSNIWDIWTDHLGDESPAPVEKKSFSDEFHADDNKTKETSEFDREGKSNWLLYRKRNASERAYLQRSGDEEAPKEHTFTSIDDESGPLCVTKISPWEVSERNVEPDLNGGSCWRSAEGMMSQYRTRCGSAFSIAGKAPQ